MDCPSCHSLLSVETQHIPHLLPCGHTFCSLCIGDLLKTQDKPLICPNCKCHFNFPNLNLISKNLTMDYSSSQTNLNVSTTHCELCSEKHPGAWKCLDCGETMCEFASQVHLKSKLTKHHKLISFCDSTKLSENRKHLNFAFPKTCILHKQPIEFLSHDSDSKRTHILCPDCVDSKSVVTRLGKSSLPLIQSKVLRIRDLNQQAKTNMKGLRVLDATDRLHCSKEVALSDLHRLFQVLRGALDEREREIERQILEAFKDSEGEIEQGKERSRVWEEQLSLLMKCVEEMEQAIEYTPLSPIPSPSPASPPHPNTLLEIGSEEKGLMVDVCLLEEALGQAVTSISPDMLNSIHPVRDQLSFSPSLTCTPSKLQSEAQWSDLCSRIGSLVATSSVSEANPTSLQVAPRRLASEGWNWSRNHISSLRTLYQLGQQRTQLNSPNGLTYIEEEGMFYVCDDHNHRIQRFRLRDSDSLSPDKGIGIEFHSSFIYQDTDMEFSLATMGMGLASASASSLSLFSWFTPSDPQSSSSALNTRSGSGPAGLCVSPRISPTDLSYCPQRGLYFICDWVNHCLHVCQKSPGPAENQRGTTTILRVFGKEGKGPGQFDHPFSSLVYRDELYVADTSRVQVFSLPGLGFLREISSSNDSKRSKKMNNPYGLAILDDKLYVAEPNQNRVSVFNPTHGSFLFSFGDTPKGTLDHPKRLLVYQNLIFVSQDERDIAVFTKEGEFLYEFPSSEGKSQPRGMVMVKDMLFVVEKNFHRIKILNQS